MAANGSDLPPLRDEQHVVRSQEPDEPWQGKEEGGVRQGHGARRGFRGGFEFEGGGAHRRCRSSW